MRMIRLGKSELSITKVGFGGIPIQRLSEEDAVTVIRRALELGVNWIDTAHGYGTSEERVGKAISTRRRESVLICTKSPGKDPESVRKHVNLSLERMRIGYVDLLQLHGVSEHDAWLSMQRNGTLDLLAELRRTGVVRHTGASSHAQDTAIEVVSHPMIETMQFPFNFVMESTGLKVLEACRRNDVGFIAMKPFGGGVFEDASVCIPFFQRYSDVVIDPGFERVGEVEEVVALARVERQLTPEEWRRIEALKAELGTTFCRRCGYCMPCPQDVAITTLMNVDSFIKRFPRATVVGDGFRSSMLSQEKCVQCGECEKKCPYKLPIVARIREALKTYQAYAAL